MKILQLTRQFLPSEGGIESVVEGLGCALQQRGHTVQVATLKSLFASGTMASKESVEAGLAVRRMRHWGPRRYPVAPAALAEIRGYDLVHIHAIDFFVDYLSILRPLHRIPLVVSTHGGIFHTKWASRFKQMYFNTITRLSLGGVGAVVCVSQQDREKFEEIVEPERIHLIENGANIDRFWSVKKRVEPGLLLGISRLAENKCVHKVLEAMAPLKDRYPAMKLEWVGADFAGLRDPLERRAIELGLGGRVRFRGATTREELYSLLERAHLFVSASAYEGFGLSTIEAMSAATVPVVTAVGAHPDVIQHEVNGFLVDAEAKDLSAYLMRALEISPRQIATMGEAARNATRRFSWTEIVPQYERIYSHVLGTVPNTSMVAL
ncbi:glycosyltransferase family 4 protein [Granulicella sp. dw_53]|uniref:glycosyltransferase family 4 protein n=1 Tax=Granulicella sp. dw_53 TaxID=2719792 RepID=UPI001BD3E10B|nr:glycosyltransferase family 4 protein [Granulicella sp. dw_53]